VSAINDTAVGYDTGGYQYPSKNSIYYGITSNSYMNIEQMGRVLEVSDEGFIYEGAWKTMQAHGYGRQINYDTNWYQGYFIDGLFDGEGTYWDNQIGPIYGTWEKGKLVKATGNTPAKFSTWKLGKFMPVSFVGPMACYYC